jgi:hypothetical protein
MRCFRAISVDKQAHSYWRQLVTKVAMVGVVFHALMVAYMLPMPVAMITPAQATSLDGPIIVCSPEGYKQITFDHDGKPVEKQLPNQHCPVCDALAASAFAAQAVQPAVLVTLTSSDVLRPVNDYRPTSIACLKHNNRGPPAHA